MSFSLNLPLNDVSFGQVSFLLMRGFFDKGLTPPLFPITGQINFNSQPQDKGFFDYVTRCATSANRQHDRNSPTLKLWHFNQGLDSFSKTHNLLTFYELDQPTPSEINVAKNVDKLLFTNNYCKNLFEQHGVESHVIPLAFDRYSFKKLEKTFFEDDRVVFNLCGKFEKRKHHEKIIKAWIKKFGNNKKYFLQCALYNPFIDEKANRDNFVRSVGGKNYENVQFLGHMPTNALYNDFLNSGDIVIGMSGAEGWGLPEFQSVGIGKHAVILNAHAYQEWANEGNSTLVEPSGKIEAYDGLFFNPNQEWNQGNIFDFNEDDFISACEESIKKTEASKVNQEGLKIQENFSIEKTMDKLIPLISE
jgi:glycosyltransferase involved in cell wall biosynthesis